MSSLSFRILRVSVGAMCVATLLNANLVAQQQKVLAPHKRVHPLAPKPWHYHKPPVPRSMVGGLWMVDANFKSTIYIKNYVETSEMTVMPTLYLSNGKAIPLQEIKLEPAGIAVVSVNDALRDYGIAPYATLRGYVEVKYEWPWDALCVTVRDVDVTHSLIYTYFLRDSIQDLAKPAAVADTHYAEGLWWKHDPAVSGFVALTNVTANPIEAVMQVSDSAANVIGEHRVAVSPHGTKTVTISELQWVANHEGGIKVTYVGADHSILVHGGLQDPGIGYSANIPFYSSPPVKRDPKPSSFGELGLMTGAADPMLSFPGGTAFDPYSLVHNVSDWPLSVTPTLYWMDGGTARSFQARTFTLLPHHSADLDVEALLEQAGLKHFNGSFNVILDVPGDATSLLMASGSVDKSGNYVFEVLPRGVGETSAQGFSYWSIGNGDDTMVTLWNPADETQDFVLTLFFSGGHYNFPIHLGPRATLMLNVSEIVQNQTPDAEGNVIPPTVREGSGEVAGIQGINQSVLLVGAVGIYNVKKATCGSGCWQCTAGTTEAFLELNPFGVNATDQYQLTCKETLKGGLQAQCQPTSWSSSKTSVATVGGTGVVTGVTPGLVTIAGGGWGDQNTGDGTWCIDPPVSCLQQPITPAPTSGTVHPKITSIAPNFGKIGTTVPVTISGMGFGVAPTVNFQGTGITVTYGTRGDQKIVATFTIAANAPLGTQGVTVTNTTTGDGGSPTSDPANFQVTPSSPVPVDFHLTSAEDIGGGVTLGLERNFAWESSSGANPPTDLTSCSMREYVTYSNTNNAACPAGTPGQCYYPASPPWAKSGQGGSGYPNPTSPQPGPATGGTSQDVNSVTNLNFVKPYVANSFPSTQYIQYSCNGGAWTNLYGPITITRSVSQSGIKWIGTVSASDTPVKATYALL